jgi:hypothetical protein
MNWLGPFLAAAAQLLNFYVLAHLLGSLLNPFMNWLGSLLGSCSTIFMVPSEPLLVLASLLGGLLHNLYGLAVFIATC